MRKKIVTMIVAVSLAIGIFPIIPAEQAKAAEEIITIDDSVLLEDAEESIGEMGSQTKGQYLQSGSSRIVKSGTGKITVGGTTIAQRQVSKIKVSVMVERLLDGKWASYTSWSASKTNAYSVSTSKTLTVPRGYYYRVRSIHNANSDIGNSNTNALYVE